MSRSSSNEPAAKNDSGFLNNFKYEVANELYKIYAFAIKTPLAAIFVIFWRTMSIYKRIIVLFF